MKYRIERTNKFTKQYSKLYKQNNFKEEEFIKVLAMLANDEVLPAKYRNHVLEPRNKRNMGVSCTTRCFTRI